MGKAMAMLKPVKTFSIDSVLIITHARTNKAKLFSTDVFTSNGVIHVIDKAISP
jgi:uncharacterized surface protein with fasciclin (FAS1) repeats